jgi:hypothetical protein
MLPKQILLTCATILVCATGCGTMLVETNRADAEIYLDGVHIGTGRGEADATGFPKTSVIRVESDGEVIERHVKRRFTTKTAIVGIFSYFTGFLWAWDFPDRVSIHFSDRRPQKASGWGPSTTQDSWSQPYYTTPEHKDGKTKKEAPKESLKPIQPKPLKSDADPWKQPLEPSDS